MHEHTWDNTFAVAADVNAAAVEGWLSASMSSSMSADFRADAASLMSFEAKSTIAS
jgi:hypothetical protein|eukprot:COSAG02_NODE_1668_length_11402_cov_21.101743_6_plen_56_part_00